jgi:adenylate kinase family enzyme
MAEIVLILGKSGSGKSYACRNLDPAKTLLVSVDGK